MFHHTSLKTSRRDVEALETLESLGSFKVSASVSETATSRFGLGEVGLGSRLGLGLEGLVHIPAKNTVVDSYLALFLETLSIMQAALF